MGYYYPWYCQIVTGPRKTTLILAFNHTSPLSATTTTQTHSYRIVGIVASTKQELATGISVCVCVRGSSRNKNLQILFISQIWKVSFKLSRKSEKRWNWIPRIQVMPDEKAPNHWITEGGCSKHTCIFQQPQLQYWWSNVKMFMIFWKLTKRPFKLCV